MVTRMLPLFGLLVLLAGTLACATTATSGSATRFYARAAPLTPTSRVIGRERVSQTGAPNAYEALRLLLPSYRVSPYGVRDRDLSDWRGVTPTEVLVMLDNHPIADPDLLRSVPSHEIVAIHVLNGIEATTLFGSGRTAGAIVVETVRGFRQR
jgi:hypothetical protein